MTDNKIKIQKVEDSNNTSIGSDFYQDTLKTISEIQKQTADLCAQTLKLEEKNEKRTRLIRYMALIPLLVSLIVVAFMIYNTQVMINRTNREIHLELEKLIFDSKQK